MSPRFAYALLGFTMILLVGGSWYKSQAKGKSAVEQEQVTTKDVLTKAVTMQLTSSAFAEGGKIPSTYTCDARSVSPPLTISGAPEGTKSFVLIVDDPDVPKAVKPDGYFLHMVLFNIPGDTKEVAEGKLVGVFGNNGAGHATFIGPCPPPQYEPKEHRYFFHLYALDTEIPLITGASKESVESRMVGHVLDESRLMARYARIQK